MSVEELVLKSKDVNLYNYQKNAVKFVLNNISKTNVLLAAAPNAGKTFMASFIINELVKKGSRVLCSVHGTNVLKRQFYNSIISIVGFENVSVYDTSDLSLYNPKKPVQVMIYQNTKQMEECVGKYGEFDYLVVDEAHKFYDGTDSMSTIGDEFVSGNHLLLTGSPAIFKEKVDSGEIKATYISASLIESLYSGQYDKDIRLDIVSNDVHLTLDDYNSNGEVIEKSEKKLINNEPVLESLLIDDFGKTIIFVKRTKQADVIKSYLDKRGITNFISHSKSDKNSTLIEDFKNDYTGVDNVVLIVVGRATEGFDDPNVSIIDITYSKNIDTLYQRYSRAIRNRTDAKDKRYVKVVPSNDNSAEVFVHIMTAVLMLLKQEHFENFNGKNFSIPTFKQEIKKPKCGVGSVKTYTPTPKHETNDINDNSIIIKSSDKPQSVKELVQNKNFVVNVKVDDGVYEIKTDEYNQWVEKLKDKKYTITIEKSNDRVDDCLLMETRMYSGAFFDTKNELYNLITRYATSSLQDVLKEINGEIYASEQEHIDFIKENDIRSNIPYRKVYKSSNLKLHSTPWREYAYGNGSSKDYFDSIWGNQYLSEQEHIDFIKENYIRGSGIYGKKYKKYGKKYKNNDLNLYSNPWKKFGNSKPIDYFKSIWDKEERYIEQEHIDFIKNNNIRDGNQYSKQYKSNDLNLYSTPWKKFGNGKPIDYFESIRGEKYATKEEHIDFIKNNNIRGSNQYKKVCKNNDLNLYSAPWIKFGNGKPIDYFESIWGEKEKKEKIKRDYSPAYLWGEKYATKEEHIDFIKENNIRNSNQYKKVCKNNDLNLYSAPWKKHGNGKEKDYFESIWGEKEKIKRDYSPAYLGDFSEMNKKWNTSNSNTTHQRLKEDKSEWIKYHELYSKSRETWNEIPYKEIAKKINVRPDWIIGDFGCGENLLSKEIKNKVYAFDHIAIDDNVVACDITNVPLEDNFLDVAVFSLSLMGSNYKEYLKEAHRVLKPMGILYISEPYKRWEDKIDQLKNTLSEIGFKMIDDVEHNYKFIYIRLIK